MFDEPRLVEAFNQVRRLGRLESALKLLGWDQETQMPAGGAASRAAARGDLSEVIHLEWCKDKLGDVLAAALEAAQQSGDDRTCRWVAQVQRDRDRRLKIPAELESEKERACSVSLGAWQEAREKSDFSIFAPHLERVLSLTQRIGQARQEGDISLYEALMDEYEPGARIDTVQRLLDQVQPVLVELVGRYGPLSRQVPTDFLRRHYPRAKQEQFGRAVLSDMGFDFDRGVVAVSAHPFCNGLASPADVRVTTRYHEDDLRPALFGLIHEGGHALYEQGFPARAEGTPGAEAKSLSLHESQSLLWENKVARGAPFWQHYFEPLRACYPGTLDDVSREEFVRAINVVEPSLIRVEADEVTYSLHIALRVELEQALIAGDLAVRDIPGVWDDRMESLLGLRPPTVAEGALQDIHWSFGAFGYFPTYFLGNLYAAQFFATAHEKIDGLDEQIAGGELGPLRSWLGENIHQLGCLYTAEEVCERVTGNTLDARHFLTYLRGKLEVIHG